MIEPEFISIPEGSIQIGSTKNEIMTAWNFWKNKVMKPEYKPHLLLSWFKKELSDSIRTLDSFNISKFPITNGQYKEFTDDTKYPEPPSFKNYGILHPVWGVTLEDALEFCSWLSNKFSFTYSLPSEEQWEYAARGNKRLIYPYGNKFDSSKGNSIESKIGSTTPVDKYKDSISPFGVYDMAGNVEELTRTPYTPFDHQELIKDDLFHWNKGRYVVLKGGSFSLGGDLTRAARRHGSAVGMGDEFKYIGFRIVK